MRSSELAAQRPAGSASINRSSCATRAFSVAARTVVGGVSPSVVSCSVSFVVSPRPRQHRRARRLPCRPAVPPQVSGPSAARASGLVGICGGDGAAGSTSAVGGSTDRLAVAGGSPVAGRGEIATFSKIELRTSSSAASSGSYVSRSRDAVRGASMACADARGPVVPPVAGSAYVAVPSGPRPGAP